MLERFAKQRSEMEALRKMVENDKGLERVDQDWSKPEDPSSVGVSAQRIADYRTRFHRLGITRGFSAFGESNSVDFLVWCQGLAIAGSAKGFARREKTPENLIADTDEYQRKNHVEYEKMIKREPNNWEKHIDIYRRIDGNWYLHFEN